MTIQSDAVQPAAASTGVPAWRVLLRMLSGISVLFLFAYWGAAGGNRGWSRTVEIPLKQSTLAEGAAASATHAAFKTHFEPGLDLLAVALTACVVLFAITFVRVKNR